MDFAGKRVTIIGLAREGTALARFLAEQGAIVTVSDLKTQEELQENIAKLQGLPIRFVLGGHPGKILEQTNILFLSPGVPLEVLVVAEAKRRGIAISSETNLFTELCPAPIIGITGSSGKTTTVSLVGQMLKASGFRTWVGGNIGQPLIGYLEEIEPTDKVVMELSSFQLEIMAWSPPIAAILNITPNHLDRHPSMEAYTEAKLNILRFQQPGNVAILGYDLISNIQYPIPNTQSRILTFSLNEEMEQGTFLQDGKAAAIILRLGDTEQRICSADEIKLLGRHNLANVLAACTIAAAAGASRPAMAHVATTFEGVEHRLEMVREIGGVRYYNDSIATSPERTVAALRSFDQPIVLLAGGRDKHLPWDEMARLTLEKVKHLVLFGEAVPIIEQAIQDARVRKQETRCRVHKCAMLEDAVEVAAREAKPGDVVLLSPGGTSFDAFRDFVERGQRFRELVKTL